MDTIEMNPKSNDANDSQNGTVTIGGDQKELAADTFVTPPPSPELKRLEPLLGKWNSRAHTEESILGPGVPVASTEEFYWLDGGYFLVQTYETSFGMEPVQKGINYWFYDAQAKKFRIIFFSNNGPYTEDGNRYEEEIVHGTLTFTGPARFQYDLDATGKIRRNDDGTITVKWWLRDEGGQFRPWMNDVFRREDGS